VPRKPSVAWFPGAVPFHVDNKPAILGQVGDAIAHTLRLILIKTGIVIVDERRNPMRWQRD